VRLFYCELRLELTETNNKLEEEEQEEENKKKIGTIDSASAFTTSTTMIQFKNQRCHLNDLFCYQLVYKTEDTQSPLPPVPPLNLDLVLYCHPRSARSVIFFRAQEQKFMNILNLTATQTA